MNCQQIAKRKQAHAQHRSVNMRGWRGWYWSIEATGETIHYTPLQLDNSSPPRKASIYIVDESGNTTLVAKDVDINFTE